MASWSATSAKAGNGLELLRDGRLDTYWQSEGLQPHLISIQFNQRMLLSELHLLLDFKQDESYTPTRISIRAGTSHGDLKEIKVVEIHEPTGWISFALGTSPLCEPSAQGQAEPGTTHLEPLQAFLLQLAVLTNHQNGRDSHIRGIRVYGPMGDHLQAMLGMPLAVTTPEFAMYAMAR